MRHFSFLLALGLTATPALSDDACKDLWLARNIIMDQAGQCFSSPLARITFNNGDCKRGQAINLTAEAEDRVARIKAREAELNCNVNTNARKLTDVTAFARRHRLTTQPIASGTESACFGYKGQRVALYASPSSSAQQFGFVEAGDDVLWAHDNEGEWSFVIRKRPGFDMVGWTNAPIDQCTSAAG